MPIFTEYICAAWQTLQRLPQPVQWVWTGQPVISCSMGGFSCVALYFATSNHDTFFFSQEVCVSHSRWKSPVSQNQESLIR